MSEMSEITQAERKRIAAVASQIASCYRSGLGKCLTVASGPSQHQTAQQLQKSLAEEGINSFVEPLASDTFDLSDKSGVWIVNDAHALETLVVTGWLKTQTDLKFPALRLIMVLDKTPSSKIAQNLDLLGAIRVGAI